MKFDPVDKNQKQFSAFVEKISLNAEFDSAEMYFDSGLKFNGCYCSFFLIDGNFLCIPSIKSYNAGAIVFVEFTGEEIFQSGLKTIISEINEEIPLEIFTSGMPIIR